MRKSISVPDISQIAGLVSSENMIKVYKSRLTFLCLERLGVVAPVFALLQQLHNADR